MQILNTLSFLLAAFPALIASQGADRSCPGFALTGGDPPGIWIQAQCNPLPNAKQITRIKMTDCFGNYGGEVKPLVGNGDDYGSIDDCDVEPLQEEWTAKFTCDDKETTLNLGSGVSNWDGKFNCNGKDGYITTKSSSPPKPTTTT